MSESTVASADATTTVAPQATPPPTDPAPDASPNGQTPGAPESNAQTGSGAGEPSAAKPEEGQQGEQKEKPKSRFQERIDELTASRREAERRAAAAEARANDLQKRLTPPGPNASLEEHDDYRLRRALNESRAEELHSEAQSAQAEAAQRTFDTFAAKAEAVADRMPGLVEKFCKLPEVTRVMAEFVADSEKGAEVAHFLAETPHEAARIARLSQAQQGIELARLEGKLSVAPQIRKVSTAPHPPPTVSGNPSPASKTTDEMSSEEMAVVFKKRGLIR